ncbi:MAG: DUF2249 domain-containing protein [Rhodopseudomonas palustris]|uniref:DUF2249 domain-containing protein n=1 Tax=Rhodopseudomonas palustris TaxID=1076 RepID=A0A933S0I3_RHOPL|nr:DUF2249 domain-containing protein [Rhodopseudomonas palustris]
MTYTDYNERVIQVAEIEPRLRHGIIEELFRHLSPGHGLQIVVDHDPRRLRFLLDVSFGSQCDWTYLEQGPDLWRIRLRYTAAVTRSGFDLGVG